MGLLNFSALQPAKVDDRVHGEELHDGVDGKLHDGVDMQCERIPALPPEPEHGCKRGLGCFYRALRCMAVVML